MKKMTRWLAALGMTAALLGVSALADEPTVHVQLDGAALTFTDAVPQVRDRRTFLPFRAVFEAMGAEVKSEGSVITAARDGKTLTMTLNETAATLTEGDKTTPITMDVAPYVDSATWRTYVPVRFAAQAFGCAVGWDQQNSTAIIVDTDKVVNEALEGKSFTYLEKLMAYSEKYNKGIWDMEAGFDADMTMMSRSVPMSGTMKGTVQDGEKLSMDMNMKMDMEELVNGINLLNPINEGQPTEMSAEEKAMLDELKEKGIDLSMRGDMGKGTFFMNMRGDILAQAGLNSDTWYTMDMNSLMAQTGMDWAQLMENSQKVDYMTMVKETLSSLPLDDSTKAYPQVKETVAEIARALSDEGFVKEGDEYTALLELEEDGTAFTVVLTLSMKDDAVTAYLMSFRVGTQVGTPVGNMVISMDMTTTVDDKDEMKAEMNMDINSLLAMTMTMDGKYTPGQTAPQTEPPAGANVADLMELMAAEMGAENAAPGGIGPTAIVVGG